MMKAATAKINAKGQVTIPKSVINALNVYPGDRIEFIKVSDKRFEIIAVTNEISRIKGMIHPKRSVSIGEMCATNPFKTNIK